MYNQGQNKGQTQPDKDKQILSDETNRGEVRKGQGSDFQGQNRQGQGNQVGGQYSPGQGNVPQKAPSR